MQQHTATVIIQDHTVIRLYYCVKANKYIITIFMTDNSVAQQPQLEYSGGIHKKTGFMMKTVAKWKYGSQPVKILYTW